MEHGGIVLEYVPSVDNLVDIPTKGLRSQPHKKLAIMMVIYLGTGGGVTEKEC